ncbi:hypothetical protein CFAM422_013275 [Trichoderma lentiforme]|uniref:Uncharacterized protein n=1 Tax=Trichoderma lentiforme TaxID=1567552 RepID=A0A9P5C5U1_9HYPO|nr:hypothetical protein CFAM422_013275 [Trichoderma lentiforme]
MDQRIRIPSSLRHVASAVQAPFSQRSWVWVLGLIISLDVLTDGIAQGLELLLIDVVCAAAPPIKDLNWVRTRLSVDLGVVPCRGPQYPPKTVGVIKNGPQSTQPY